MIRLFIIAFTFSGICYGQNNSIFGGGARDGVSQSIYRHPQNHAIFSGGPDDGSASRKFFSLPDRPIFAGGAGHGSDQDYFAQPLNSMIFAGGADDGVDQQIFSLPANNFIFYGGPDDGVSQIAFRTVINNKIFAGGADDGYHQITFTGLPDALNPPFKVDLLSFDAWPEGEVVHLQWITASEVNHNFFEVERSQNTSDTEVIATVAGSGAANQLTTYEAEDPSPWPGRSFYRLRSVDLDGTGEYSAWVEVNFQAGNRISVSLYPNPTPDKLNIYLTGEWEGEINMAFFDLAGRKIPVDVAPQLKDRQAKSTVSLKSLPPGIYILNIVEAGSLLLGSYRIQVLR